MKVPLSGSIGRRTNGEWERIKFVLQVGQYLVDDFSIFDNRYDIHLRMAVRGVSTIIRHLIVYVVFWCSVSSVTYCKQYHCQAGHDAQAEQAGSFRSALERLQNAGQDTHALCHCRSCVGAPGRPNRSVEQFAIQSSHWFHHILHY
jgi:hypothetical protein